MPENRLYLPAEIDFACHNLSDREEPRCVFMVKPDYFDIVDVKNPYMEGNRHTTQKDRAWQQWQVIYNLYKDLEEKGVLNEVAILDGIAGCEDMVFCANQSLPWMVKGSKTVVLSHMRYPSRQKEVAAIGAFYLRKGYHVLQLATADLLEGNGDVIPHPGKQLLWAGYGHRSGIDALREVAELLQVPVIPLRLVSDYFYHLDTCFVPLGEDTVMLCPDAFDDMSILAIEKVFANVYRVSRKEAVETFSLNAHCLIYPAARFAILQKGSKEVLGILQKEGFEIMETETGEFIKSGGSVFCMKMMYY